MKFISFILLLCQLHGFSQNAGRANIKQQQPMPVNGLSGSRNAFIKNIGQYGDTMAGHAKMGSIKYGYEGFDMLVLFTPKGLMHLHRKIKRPSKREEEELERKGIPEEEIEKRVTITDKIISMEWEGANPDPEIIAEEEKSDYHTYGLLKDIAHGYKKITYKNLYPGIDVIYHFTNTDKTGFEYSIVLQPGADPGPSTEPPARRTLLGQPARNALHFTPLTRRPTALRPVVARAEHRPGCRHLPVQRRAALG